MSTASSTLTQKTTSGVAWSGIFQIARQGLSLISVSVLARLVPPSAYGLIAMAVVLSNFFDSIRDLGTGNAIIRELNPTERFVATLFWANCILGVFLAACVYALSFPAAAFFHQPALVAIIQVVSANFAIGSLGIVPSALLSRKMAFRQLGTAQFLAALLGTATAVTMAYFGMGVWSLVFGTLATTTATALLVWVYNPIRILWTLDFRIIRSISHYTLNLSGFGVVNYFSRNVDNLIVGRFLGSSPLGFYQMGYTLMTFPLQNFSSMIAQVVFPAMAQVREHEERTRSAFIRTSVLIAFFTFPAMLGLFVTADPFVRSVLGAKWLPVASLLLVFAPLGMLQSVMTVNGVIYNVKGRSDWQFAWGTFSGALYVLSFFLGLRWGIQGVANCYALMWLALLPINLMLPLKLLDLRFSTYLRNFWPVAQVNLAMVAVAEAWLWGIRHAGISNPPVQLVTTSVVGAVAYCLFVRWWKVPAARELVEILQHSQNRFAGIAARLLT